MSIIAITYIIENSCLIDLKIIEYTKQVFLNYKTSSTTTLLLQPLFTPSSTCFIPQTNINTGTNDITE